MAGICQVIKDAMVAVVSVHFLFDEDEDLEEMPNILEKAENYAEVTIPQFNNKLFQQHFRVSPTTFEDLLQKLSRVTHHFPCPGRAEISLEKQGMITLCCLSNMESFRSLGDRFGVTKSSCWAILYRSCHRILAVNDHFKIISWPRGERALAIMQSFQEICGFRGVLGCIDGSHIKILPPQNYANSYCNRKSFHSILLQGVCDNNKLFTHAYSGEPGSMHDNRLFEKSDLFAGIEARELEFPQNSHMLGDLAYKLRPNLLVGFKSYINLTNRQKNFNLKLSKTRGVIENAFALLKGRFRRLKYMETNRIDLIPLLTTVACILHNICVLKGDNPLEIMDLDEELEEERRINRDDVISDLPENNRLAVIKRQEIMYSLIMYSPDFR